MNEEECEVSLSIGRLSKETREKLPFVKVALEYVFTGPVTIEDDGTVYLYSPCAEEGDISHGRYLQKDELDKALAWALSA